MSYFTPTPVSALLLRPVRHSLAILSPWFRIISLERSSHLISPNRFSFASLRRSLTILHVQNFCLWCPIRDPVPSFSNSYSRLVVPSVFPFTSLGVRPAACVSCLPVQTCFLTVTCSSLGVLGVLAPSNG